MAALTALWAPPRAAAQAVPRVLPGAASVADPAGAVSHGWLIEPDPQGGGYFLVHVPPRVGPADALTGEGAARRIERLERAPVSMAALGSRVYLAFPDAMGTVLSLDAELVGAGLYRYTPTGRLRAEPAVGQGVVQIAAAAGRLWALTRAGGAHRGHTLRGTEWVAAALPAELSEASGDASRVWITGDDRTLMVVEARATPAAGAPGAAATQTGWNAWSTPASAETVAADAVVELAWVRVPVAAEAGLTDPVGTAWFSDEPVAVHRRGARWSVVPLRAGAPPLASFDALGGPASWVVLPDAGRVVVLSTEPGTAGRLGEPARRIDEASLLSGRALYSGPVRSGSPVTAQDARLLAAGLVALLALAAFYVLRSERRPTAIVLPRGASLAEPGRRVVATLIDWTIAAVVVSLVFDFDLVPVVMVVPALALPGGLAGVGSAWAGAVLLSTVAEGLSGATLGKRLVGCRVVRVGLRDAGEGRARGPGFWRAFVRQVFKWAFVPLAAAGMSSLERRHRGDLAAGCAVVVEAENEAQ